MTSTVGITDQCGVCGANFELIYSPDQYPAVETTAGTWDLICDPCQNELED